MQAVLGALQSVAMQRFTKEGERGRAHTTFNHSIGLSSRGLPPVRVLPYLRIIARV